MTQTTATLYTALWLTFVVLNALLVMLRRDRFALLSRDYLRFLAQPWKLVVFGVALIGFVLIAPYTGDATWDWFDAAFMSILTYLTAPGVVAIIVRARAGQIPSWQLGPALALWLLSASWLYDLYIWRRDGHYPPTWSSNLIASSVLYLCAGLLWNLSSSSERAVTLAFLEAEWPPTRPHAPSRWLWLCVLGFVLFVTAMMSPFLLELAERL